ncbi:MAG: HAMP domain-containing histidine kinase [Ruminococcus sp.]|nr:HAMP domain-containing histidine kinase [Ruminococcus sp.]
MTYIKHRLSSIKEMMHKRHGYHGNQMLNKLQRRFIAITMTALVVITLVLLFFVNAVNVYQRDSEVRNILYIITENGGMFPNDYRASQSYLESLLNPFKKVQITIETPYATRYFVVKLKDNTVSHVSTKNIASITDDIAINYASQIYQSEPGFGFIDSYRYYYTKNSNDNTSMMVFIDYERELDSSFQLASISMFVAVLGILLLAWPVYKLSRNALHPVERSIEKQKQFITDAGHELKTPIAIISADAEVLEMCDGENEWLTSIREQTVRLDRLVKDLVTLSKLDEDKVKPKFERFDISEAVLDSATNFETMAKSKGLDFIVNVTPDLTYNGNESEIRQLVSILGDNAVKYCSDGGTIKFSLYKSGKTIHLDVYNDCDYIDKSKLDRLFDRFYRADSSRSRETGGYGIGLSIAKVVVTRHKGKITATSSDSKSVTFKVTL